MLVLSHRGYHLQAPENTIEAFSQAVQRGVDGIETDLRRTRDGQIILFHDRIVPDGREIASLTRAEVAAAMRYAVPTIDEALSRFDGLLWNLEIKVPEALDGALDALRQFGNSRRRFLITSFWHPVVAAFRARALADSQLAGLTNLQFGLLCADHPLELRQALGLAPGATSTEYQTIVWYFDILDEPLLMQARKLGLANWVYGVRTADDHRRCRDLGLDGVITDRPEMMAHA